MKRLRIYVDTSVIGGCFDERFAEKSRALIDMAREGKVVLVVSSVLARELIRAPAPVREILESLPAEAVEQVSASPESEALRDAYLTSGVVRETAADDAHHVALATVHRASAIVSWNFKHIVHYEKIRGFNAVNLREGYPPIAIHAPPEVV